MLARVVERVGRDVPRLALQPDSLKHAALRADGTQVMINLNGLVLEPSDFVVLDESAQQRRALDQLALAALIRSGRYDRHLRKMRGVYARRRTALIEALERHAPGVRLTGLAAGFHAVAHLPDGADEDAVVAQALRRSVGLYGMAPFRAARVPAPPQLVLGFGLTGERAIEAGIAAVADLLSARSA